MKKAWLLLAFAMASQAHAAAKSGFGVHGSVGSDFRGVGYGGGVSWASPAAPWEIDGTLLLHNNTYKGKDETDPYEYTETTSMSIMAVRANWLPGHSYAEVSPFFILGGGLAVVSLDYSYKEKSLSPSYATNYSTSFSGSSTAFLLNIGGGVVAPGGFEARLELPVMSFSAYAAGVSVSVVVPTLVASAGYRF